MVYTISNDNTEIHFSETGVMNNKFIADFLKHFFPEDPIFKEELGRAKAPKLPYAPTSADFDKVLSVVKGQDYVMLKAFELTGARRKEVFGLKWSDILFDQDLIYIWSSKRTPEEKELDYIPMDAELKELLLEWKEKQPMETEYVFVNDDPKSKGYGKPFKDRRRFMHNVCEQAGVPYFGFHSIRRFTAMQLLDAEHPMSHIQRILRHKAENTTAQFIHEIITRS